MAYERGEKVKDIALNWQTSERNVYKWLARWCTSPRCPLRRPLVVYEL